MPFEERYPHPTQKPLLLCEKLVIGFTGEGDTVLDPFAGSGTIPLAAAKHKRNFIGFEINERYVRMGRERIDFEMKQLSFM
jgi:site-specific DNA-methyltransferase (adenine-specific)